jgi:hypothetical protein
MLCREVSVNINKAPWEAAPCQLRSNAASSKEPRAVQKVKHRFPSYLLVRHLTVRYVPIFAGNFGDGLDDNLPMSHDFLKLSDHA